MLRTAEADARVEGSREELFQIVTDYGRWQAWMPGVEHSRLLVREGDVTIAELAAPDWAPHPFNLELVHSPPGTVEFHQIDSLGRGAAGRWELGTTDPGVGASTVSVSVSLRLDTPALALASGPRLRATLRAWLDALGARRRHLAAARPGAPTAKRKLLEVVRGEGGLEVWYLGETFLLPKARRSGRG